MSLVVSGGVWWCLGVVCKVSGGCLRDVRGVLWCLGGVRWCFGGVLDTFLDPGTLGPPRDIQESRTPGLIGLIEHISYIQKVPRLYAYRFLILKIDFLLLTHHSSYLQNWPEMH